MNTHYFIGIKVPDSIASSIIEARNKTNLHETHKTLPVAEDLHITLFYLGAVESNLMELVIQSLQSIDWNSFTLTTSVLSHFGNDQTPRVVYLALEENRNLISLQQEVLKRIASVLEIDVSKDFHPHITLAKKWASKAIFQTVNPFMENKSFDVNGFSIFKINPTSTPRYEKFSSIRFRRV